MRRGPGWSDGGSCVLGTLLQFTRYGSVVSPRVVAGGEEVAVEEARILIPGMVCVFILGIIICGEASHHVNQLQPAVSRQASSQAQMSGKYGIVPRSFSPGLNMSTISHNGSSQ